MTATRGVSIVVVSCVGCAFLGTLLGYLIGRLAPEYYRLVFHVHSTPEDLAKIGAVLGLTQGLGIGIAIGLVIAICVTWYEVRKMSPPVSTNK